MTDPGLLKNNTAEGDYSRRKVGGLIAAHVVCALIFGIVLRFALLAPSTFAVLYAAAAGILFLASFLLVSLLVKSSYLAAIAIILHMGALIGALYDHFSFPVFTVSCVTLLIFLASNYAGRRELTGLLAVRFWRIGKAVLPKAILAISIFIGGLYYSMSSTVLVTQKTLPISEAAFERFLEPVEAPLQYFFPEFNLEISVREFLTRMAERQVMGNKQAALLPQGVKNELVRQSVKELEDRIAAFSGGAPDPHARVPQAAYDLLKMKIGSLTNQGRDMVALLFAAFLLLVIVGFAWPLRILIAAVGFLVYELLLSSGFAIILLEGRNREIIVVK